MSLVPLPDRPCVRVRLDYSHDSGLKAGSRLYLAYAGSAPTSGNCATLATDIANDWSTNIAQLLNANWQLTEIDIIDIATRTGNSGQWVGSEAGTASGTAMPAQTAMNVEYGIGRRYRGGKPRMFLPPSVTSNLVSDVAWSSTYLTGYKTDFVAFMTAVQGHSVGAMGALTHINLSYYEGFTNITNTSGRTRAAPKYRATALSDVVTDYFPKAEVGSQRRRRVSTTY